MLDINLKGTFLCARAAYLHMVEAGGGSIVNIGSMTSIFGSDWVSSYSASKGGVVQLTRSLAIAWADKGIRVNAILPGWIRTELTSGYWTNPDNRDRLALINRRIPAGRWGNPTDLAGLAVFPFERRGVIRHRHGHPRGRRLLVVLATRTDIDIP